MSTLETMADGVACPRCAATFRPALTDAACPLCGYGPGGGLREREREQRLLALVVGGVAVNLLVSAVFVLLLSG